MRAALKQFCRNQQGNIALTAAIVMMPIMTAVGATIDYSRYYDQRVLFQDALDAAALASAREFQSNISATPDDLEIYSRNFFDANAEGKFEIVDNSYDFEFIKGDFSVDPPEPDRFRVSATLDYNVIFKGFLSAEGLHNSLASEVSLGNRTVEIALVLDNSGSMRGSKMDDLKKEATNLVNIVHASARLTSLPDPVQFSLVPFSGSVNVGTANANASWMDVNGWAPYHHENFDWENTYRTNNRTEAPEQGGIKYGFREEVAPAKGNGAALWEWKTRQSVFNMLGEEWGGCVEMRPWPHNVLDTVADSSQSYSSILSSHDADDNGVRDGTSALFVPYFAPDEPDNIYPWRSRWGSLWQYYDDDGYTNNYLYDFQDVTPRNPTQLYVNTTGPAFNNYWSHNQIRRTNWMFKYQRRNSYGQGYHEWRGPNYGCTVEPITELSTEKDVVNNAVQKMEADGWTNIQQGLTWGWRTVSAPEPFVGGRDLSDDQNMKFIVLLTDGNNRYQLDGDSTPNESAYGAWGYARPDAHFLKNPLNGLPTHNRLSEGIGINDTADTIYAGEFFDTRLNTNASYERLMNLHTNQSCNNIKEDGVTIYTVAFDVPQTGGVRALLNECSGSGKINGEEVIPEGTFYFDVDEGGLEDAFRSISSQIANLRLSG